MKLYFLLSLIPYLIYIFVKSKKAIHMLQQNYYDEGKRYLNWIEKNKSKSFLKQDLFFLFFYLILSFFASEQFNFYSFAILSILAIFIYVYNNRNTQTKIKFVITKRVKRIYATYFVINALIILLIYLNYNSNHLFIYNTLFILFSYFEYYLILLVNIINKPIEKLVYKYYENKAKNKLKYMNNIDVIGITGSYGKTSTKNIVATILNVKYTTFATPKNFNTTYGLINTVNNYLDKFTKYFIAEMGAFKVGEIKKSCDFVHPKYGILTSIGKAHLESFGSQENIQHTKFELIESLPSDGFGILNMDDPLQASYKLKNNVDIYWISMKNKNADLYATNIKLDGHGTNFDCIFKGDKKIISFQYSFVR
jgi:UDP-N-acetylmuramoyl-tripeptide--D-alanyl-D-alanine ligase